MEKQNTSLCVCISIHVLTSMSSLSHCFVSVGVCVCRGGKQREDKRGRKSSTNSLLGSLSVFDSERGSSIRKFERKRLSCT